MLHTNKGIYIFFHHLYPPILGSLVWLYSPALLASKICSFPCPIDSLSTFQFLTMLLPLAYCTPNILHLFI